jgi:VWFA-related protein
VRAALFERCRAAADTMARPLVRFFTCSGAAVASVALCAVLLRASPAAEQTPATQAPPPAPPPRAQAPSPPAAGQPAAGQPAAGQPATGQPGQQPVPFRTGINVVRVDVLVTDNKGEAVKGLTQDDFELYEDNRPQKVDSFRFIEVSGNPVEGELPKQIRTTFDEETELARDDVRLFVIFYDDYHVRRGSALAVKEPLVRFVRNQLGAVDIVAMMYPLTPFSSLGYTRNHDALIQEILRLDGRKHDYQPRNEFEEKYAYYPAETVERIRNQVSLSALKTLVQGLGSLREGRKTVILVSEGYSNYLPPSLRDPVASMPGYGNPNRRGGLAGERTPDEQMGEERAAFFQNTDLLTDLREVFMAANRANVAIYALDPRGLAAFEYDIDQGVGQQRDKAGLDQGLNTLRTLADETDGRAIINSNDLERGLKQMVKDASSYYLLGYTTQAPTDGKFHEIKVRLKRKDLQVRARKGFWALTNADVTAAASTSARREVDSAVTDALAGIETPNRAKTIRTWIGTARGENGKTAVTLVWEPTPLTPGDRRETPARVSVMAASASGSLFRGKLPDPAADEGGGAVVSPASTTGAASTSTATGGGRATFLAPPGTVQLRLSIEGAAGNVLDSDFRDLVVPDYAKVEPLLSNPAVYRARTMRDANLIFGNVRATPTTAREFSRTERLVLRFQAYAPGGGVAAPTVRLLNRGGTKMADVPVKAAAAINEQTFETDLPLGSLPAGEYLLELKLAGDGKEARQLVGFRVTS